MQKNEKIKINYYGLKKLYENNTNTIAILSVLFSLIILFSEWVQSLKNNFSFNWFRYAIFVICLLIINYLSRKRKIKYLADSYFQLFLIGIIVSIFGISIMLLCSSYVGFSIKTNVILFYMSMIVILFSTLFYKNYWEYDQINQIDNGALDLENMVLYIHSMIMVRDKDGSIVTSKAMRNDKYIKSMLVAYGLMPYLYIMSYFFAKKYFGLSTSVLKALSREFIGVFIGLSTFTVCFSVSLWTLYAVKQYEKIEKKKGKRIRVIF